MDPLSCDVWLTGSWANEHEDALQHHGLRLGYALHRMHYITCLKDGKVRAGRPRCSCVWSYN